MLSKDEAELLVRAELKDSLPAIAPTVLRFEGRLTSTGWKFATGDQIRPPGSRAQGLARRGGWQFIYDLEEEYRQHYIAEHGRPPREVMEFFPSLLVVRVYDDNCQVELPLRGVVAGAGTEKTVHGENPCNAHAAMG